MPKGTITFDAPHICGEWIHVEVHWSLYHGVHTLPNGDPGYPDDYDEDHVYTHESKDYDISKCPKCGVDLFQDDIFQATVKTLADKNYVGEEDYDPEFDGPDYERDYEPEPMGSWDDYEPDGYERQEGDL